MHGNYEATKLDISNVLTVHESLLAGASGAIQQERKEKQKNVKAQPVGQRMKTKIARASLPKDPTPLGEEEEEESEDEKEEEVTHIW